MARQRYCCGLARCWRALRLSADRAENAARKRALFGALIEESGSHMTRRWREMDSNPRSPGYGGAWCSWRRATRPMPPSRSPERRSFASTSSASDFRMPGAPFTWTKAGVELNSIATASVRSQTPRARARKRAAALFSTNSASIFRSFSQSRVSPVICILSAIPHRAEIRRAKPIDQPA